MGTVTIGTRLLSPCPSPDAIEGMLRVATYINEMQRISEMYSSLFDCMLKDSGLSEVCVGWVHGSSYISNS